MSHSSAADALQPNFTCLPERQCNAAMPEWLRSRCAQCSLRYVDASHNAPNCWEVQEDRDGVWQRSELVRDSSQLPPSVLQPPSSSPARYLAQPAHSNTSNVRWQNLVSANAASAAALEPGVGQGSVVVEPQIDAAATASCCKLSDCVTSSSVDQRLALAADEKSPTGAGTCRPLKKRKTLCASLCGSLLASPPKIYKEDKEYQRYLDDINDVGAWVRKTLLDQ